DKGQDIDHQGERHRPQRQFDVVVDLSDDQHCPGGVHRSLVANAHPALRSLADRPLAAMKPFTAKPHYLRAAVRSSIVRLIEFAPISPARSRLTRAAPVPPPRCAPRTPYI